MLNYEIQIIIFGSKKHGIFLAYKAFFERVNVQMKYIIIAHMTISTRSYRDNAE